VQVAGRRRQRGRVAAGLQPGQVVVTAGVHVLNPGQKVKFYVVPGVPSPRLPRRGRRRGGPAPEVSGAHVDSLPTSAATTSRFNISRWALEHPALTRYLLVVLMVLGFAAYFQLGQDEDPPFTFRAMACRCSGPAPPRSRWPTR
jgi:hypothetical protein